MTINAQLYIWHGEGDNAKHFRMNVTSLDIYESQDANQDRLELDCEEGIPHPNQKQALMSIIDGDLDNVTVEISYTENSFNKAVGCFVNGSAISVSSDFTQISVDGCCLWKRQFLRW